MLRLSNPEITHRVPITVGGEEVIFHLKSIGIGQRMKWLGRLQNTKITEETAIDAYPRTLELVAGLIDSIEGYEEAPLQILELLEHQSDVMDIMNGVIGFSNLSDAESKNSESSLGQEVSDSAGEASVGTIAETDNGRVLTIPTESQPEVKE